ncbi:MAG TPA: tetratricopeptide repeat protein [Ktedonobacterales bacterium]|nr:tetratricopeptide repeat protein [Ktedonobacterales bacterium]
MEETLPKTIGSYRVITLLGEGTMGAVYRARLPLMPEQDYAVKLLWERCKPKEVSTFLGECSKVKRLGTHPYLVPLHFAGRDRKLGRYYVAMEFVNGPTAAQLLNEMADRQLPLTDALRIALHGALGLEHAHQRGILHLDVKPSNILIQREGNLARLADFGNAQLIEGEDERLPTYAGRGTPAYMAWEQTLQGQQAGLHPDARTDVYGLAATLYELLTGHLPLPDEQGQQVPPRHWRADLPEALEYLLMRALSRDPEQRPATMYAFRRALEYSLTSEQTSVALLPALAQRLVGREALLRVLKQRLLADDFPALCALHGLPGVGKTALVLALAHDPEVHQHFPDGVLWAGLGNQPNLSALLGAWAEALGIQFAGLAKPSDLQAQGQAIQFAIRQRRMLLVIDDAWDAPAALTLKAGGPRCAHLVTTRLPDVALRLVDEGAQVVRVQELSEADGFAFLARLAPEAVQLEPEEARALVRAVDGLPLALKLMGNYLRTQGYSGQHRRLRAALDLLGQRKERLRLEPVQAKAGEGTETSRSLMASIGTSYHALNARARSMLLALSVFPPKPNTFSEEAALAIAGASTGTLDRLVDSGLLESGGPGRYSLHQTIADYARLKRKSKQSVKRMVTFFTNYVAVHQADYGTLEHEQMNLLEVFQGAFDLGLQAELVRGVTAFLPFLADHGIYEVADLWLGHARQAALASGDGAGLATVLLHLGLIRVNCADYIQAEQYAAEGLRVARQIEDTEKIAKFLQVLGAIKERLGDYKAAQAYLEEGLALARQIKLRPTLVAILRTLGIVVGDLGYSTLSENYFREALLLAREIGDEDHIGSLLQNLGIVAKDRGEYQQAETYYQEAMRSFRQRGQWTRMTSLLQNLGGLASNRGDHQRAEAYYQEAVASARQFGQREHLCFLLTNLGELASIRHDDRQAEAYYQEGVDLARQIGHREILGVLLTGLGMVARRSAAFDLAQVYLQEALALGRELNYALLVSYTLCEWGELYLEQQCLHQASQAFQESLELARALQNQERVASALAGLARVAAEQNNLLEARQRAQESHAIFTALGHYQAAEVAAWLDGLPAVEEQALLLSVQQLEPEQD